MPFCFSSCKSLVLTSSDPVALDAVCTLHPYCTYQWECVSKPGTEFPSTPVILVHHPLIYKCSVSHGGRVQGNIRCHLSANDW